MQMNELDSISLLFLKEFGAKHYQEPQVAVKTLVVNVCLMVKMQTSGLIYARYAVYWQG